MPIINITVRNKIATSDCEQIIVCGNEDYTAIFDFDEEWQSYEYKTARFAFNKSVITVIIEDNQCEIPKLPNTFLCGVEVRAGEKYTTTPAWIDCLPNLDEEYGEIEPPTPEVYDKIMELLDKAEQNYLKVATKLDNHLNDLAWYAKHPITEIVPPMLVEHAIEENITASFEIGDKFIIGVDEETIEATVGIIEDPEGDFVGFIVSSDNDNTNFDNTLIMVQVSENTWRVLVGRNYIGKTLSLSLIGGEVEKIPEIYLPMDTLATKKFVEEAIANKGGGGGESADLSNYYNKEEVDDKIATAKEEMSSAIDDAFATFDTTITELRDDIGDISSALDELHNYAQNLVSGVSEQ